MTLLHELTVECRSTDIYSILKETTLEDSKIIPMKMNKVEDRESSLS